jgi:hypothetical protein
MSGNEIPFLYSLPSRSLPNPIYGPLTAAAKVFGFTIMACATWWRKPSKALTITMNRSIKLIYGNIFQERVTTAANH